MGGIQITLRNVRRSTALTERIRKMCDHLQLFHPRILATRVTLEGPGPNQHQGGEFTVSVTIQVPRREIAATHSRGANVNLALSDAFAAVRRQLLDASKTRQFVRD